MTKDIYCDADAEVTQYTSIKQSMAQYPRGDTVSPFYYDVTESWSLQKVANGLLNLHINRWDVRNTLHILPLVYDIAGNIIVGTWYMYLVHWSIFISK